MRRVAATHHRVPGEGFTHAVVTTASSELVFVSGLTARGPDGTVIGAGDLAVQLEVVFAALADVLARCGSSLAAVVAVRVYLRDVSGWPAVEGHYRESWPDGWPASTCVEVSRLVDPDQLVEIDAVAEMVTPGRAADCSGSGRVEGVGS